MNEDAAGGGRPRNYEVPSGSPGPPPLHFGPPFPPGGHPPQADAIWRGNAPNLGPTAMGAQGPPGYGGWAPVAKRRRSRRWWLLGSLSAFVVIAVVIGVVTVRSIGSSDNRQATTDTGAPANSAMPPVPMSALDGMLPSPTDIAAAVSAPSLVSLTKPAESHAFFADLVVDSDCAGVAFAATQSFYEGTGWVSMRKQFLADTPDNNAALKYAVTEAVVAFQDAGAAAKFYHRALDTFHRCANRSINLRDLNSSDTRAVFMMVSQANEKDGILSTSLVREGGDGWNCQRGVSVRNNIAIDTNACGYNVSNSVPTALVKPIAAKIDAAR